MVRVLLLVSAFIAILAGVGYRLTMPGARLLLQYLNADKEGKNHPPLDTVITPKGMEIPLKLYQPQGSSQKAWLVVHGVHYRGYEEPRLVEFAQRLVDQGLTVVTPDVYDLKNYELTPRVIDQIEQCALWMLDRSEPAVAQNKISLFGISFAGGLCIRAATRESLKGRISGICSFGGHGDLDETLNYLLTGVMPDGRKRPANIYGVAVLARWFAERLVPESEIASLRGAISDFLSGNTFDLGEKFDRLPQETKKILHLCLTRDNVSLGQLLKDKLGDISTSAELSPVRGAIPSCRLFLLHGSADNIIPPSETMRLAGWARSGTRVTVLISGLIQHVDFGAREVAPPWFDYWEMVRFWTELLRS